MGEKRRRRASDKALVAYYRKCIKVAYARGYVDEAEEFAAWCVIRVITNPNLRQWISRSLVDWLRDTRGRTKYARRNGTPDDRSLLRANTFMVATRRELEFLSSTPSPEDALIEKVDKEAWWDKNIRPFLLEKCTPREIFILRKHIMEEWTQPQIADVLEITPSRVAQITKDVIARAKRHFGLLPARIERPLRMRVYPMEFKEAAERLWDETMAKIAQDFRDDE